MFSRDFGIQLNKMILMKIRLVSFLQILEMDRWSQEPVNQDPDKVDLSANGKHKPNSPSNCAC